MRNLVSCVLVLAQSTTAQSTTEQVTTEQVTTEQVTTEQVTTEQVTTPQVTTPQVTTPQVTTPQVTTPQVTTPQDTTPQPVRGCEEGWLRSPDRCFKLFGDENREDRLTYSEAYDACKNTGSTLANILDAKTQTFLTAYLAKSPTSHVWIGLKRDTPANPDTFLWINDRLNYENWGPGQPDNGGGSFAEDCAYLRANPDYPGYWYDGYCDYPRAYFCEKDQDATLPTSAPNEGCPTAPGYQFMEYGKSCFKLDTMLRSYDDAAAFCAGENTNITSITDAFQEAFIENMLLGAGLSSAWIGLETQETIDNLKWQDGQPLMFTRWDKNYPVSTTECVISTTSGWQDKECTQQHPVLCKINLDAGSIPRPPEPSRSNVRCPDSLKEMDDNLCVAQSSNSASWDAALDLCKNFSQYSILASMHSLNSLDSFKGFFATDKEDKWIGLRINQFNQYEWADGSVVDYAAFQEKPDSNEMCVVVTGSSSPLVVDWKMANCSEEKGYICGSPKEYAIPPVGGCQDGWLQMGTKCFKSNGLLEQDRKTFAEADNYCRNEGKGWGKLFHVTSQPAQSLLSLLLQPFVNETNLWIGLSDVEAEGEFEWTDGRSLADTQFTQWAPYQPDGFTEVPNEPFRDCVEVRLDPKYPGEWDDVSCLEKKGFICETYIDKNESPSDVISEACNPPAGYSKYGDSCYKFVNVTLTFDEAQALCRVDNAWVSTARDGFYNSLLTLVINWPLQGPVWIGMRQEADTDTYKWTTGNAGDSWREFTYANWAKNMPSGLECTTLQPDSTWRNEPCDSGNYFICEYTNNTNTETESPVHCPSGWTLIGRHCYKFDTLNMEYPQIHFTYSDAQHECQERYSASLPGLHSKSANEEFRVAAEKALGTRNIWLSLHRTVEGYYQYEDERVINYVNWGTGAPSQQGSNCVAMDIKSGRWISQQCFTMAGLVCETPALPGPPDPCPEGWEHRSGDCYFVSEEMDDASWLSWHEAEAWCNKRGAHLTPMKDEMEWNYVLQLLKNQGESYWIGLTDRNSPKQYYWSDGESAIVALTAWNPADVRNRDSMEHCVLVNENGLLEDHNCGIRRPYVCKFDDEKQVSLTTDAPAVGNCIPGAYKLYDRCYDLRFLNANQTWIEAHEKCNVKYGEVASIHHRGVQALLTTFLKDVKGGIWIGMTRMGKFNQFYWSDGSSLDYKNWAFGEPSSPYQANDVNYCVEMLNKADNAGEWNDVECNKYNGFICEMRVDKNQKEQSLPFKECPGKRDYLAYADSCYRLIMYTAINNNAEEECIDDGGHLASIGNAYEQAFIEMLLAYQNVEAAWIGLKRTGNDPYEWLDGWPTVFTRWAAGYPTGSSNLNGCVVMATDGWRNVDCYKAHATVCKFTTAPKPPSPPVQPGTCPVGWQQMNRKCYYFDTERTEVSFMEALAYCQRLGPNVVPASSLGPSDNTYLTNAATSLLQVNFVWLGVYYQDEEFKWVDSSPYFYTHWRTDYPIMPVGSNGCVRLAASTGLWENVDCFLKAGYVCEGPFAPTTKAPVVTAMPEKESLSTQAIIGISVGCGGVAVILVLALICYMCENSRMKQKLYTRYLAETYGKKC